MIKHINSGSVCFLNYDLSFGGTEKVIASLANQLSNSGRAVSILTLSDNNDFKSFIQDDVEIISLNIPSIRYLIPSLVRFITNRRFDNFVANVWPLTSLAFVLRIFSRKTRLIFVEHCNLSEQFKGRSSLFKLLQKISIGIFYKFAHVIVAVSEGVKYDLVSKGVDKNKIQVIYNPVISRRIEQIDELNIPAQSWKELSSKKLIAAGRMKSQKNFINLVEAISHARKILHLDIGLLILGDGEERKSIESKIHSLQLQDCIFLAGWVDDPLPYFDLADLFVLSSDYEGFGVVIVEAMSQGLNIVSTNCNSGPSEILKNGELGFLCEVNNPVSLAEAIARSIQHPIESEALLARARDFSEIKIRKLYEEVLI